MSVKRINASHDVGGYKLPPASAYGACRRAAKSGSSEGTQKIAVKAVLTCRTGGYLAPGSDVVVELLTGSASRSTLCEVTRRVR